MTIITNGLMVTGDGRRVTGTWRQANSPPLSVVCGSSMFQLPQSQDKDGRFWSSPRRARVSQGLVETRKRMQRRAVGG